MVASPSPLRSSDHYINCKPVKPQRSPVGGPGAADAEQVETERRGARGRPDPGGPIALVSGWRWPPALGGDGRLDALKSCASRQGPMATGPAGGSPAGARQAGSNRALKTWSPRAGPFASRRWISCAPGGLCGGAGGHESWNRQEGGLAANGRRPGWELRRVLYLFGEIASTAGICKAEVNVRGLLLP